MSGPAGGGRRLKVAIQIERFDPARGGAEGYAGSLVRGLAALGQEVTVICAEARGEPEGAAVVRVPVSRGPRGLRILEYARGSAEAARSGGHDIVHALGKSLGMNILNPHGGVEAVWLRQEYRSHSGWLRRSFWAARRRLSPRHHLTLAILRRQYASPDVRRYIALSRAMGDAMIEVHGVRPEKVVVVPNRVDLGRFHPPRDAAEKAALRSKLGLPAELPVFLFVSNNFRLKGLEPLLRALARLPGERPGFRLLVLGRGRPRRYRGLARRLGIEAGVEFRGPVSGIEEWYRAADACLHPTFYDASSLAVPEAMASGLAVLASRHDGSSERISDGLDGVLVSDPGDIDDLAEKLRPFLDPAFRARTGAAARARALRDAAPDPAPAMLEIYRQALADR